MPQASVELYIMCMQEQPLARNKKDRNNYLPTVELVRETVARI